MQKKVFSLFIILSLVGCAVSQQSFYKNRYSASDVNVCRAYKKSTGKFQEDLIAELSRRGVFSVNCDDVIAKQNTAIGGVALLGILGTAAVIAAKKGGFSGSPTQTSDFEEWDWDRFRNKVGQLVWACRSIQTGQFADPYHCAGKPQTDYRWPNN